MSSAEADVSLRAVARAAIARALRGDEPRPDPEHYPPALREPGASFLTLRRAGALRGCTGSLRPEQPLVCDVAQNAWRSASADPRFAPVEAAELAALEVHVAVLSPLEPLVAESERALLDQLSPGIDGLLLEDGPRRATFLPAVWATLEDPRVFLDELRVKAGLARGHWSETLRFRRYTVRDAP